MTNFGPGNRRQEEAEAENAAVAHQLQRDLAYNLQRVHREIKENRGTANVGKLSEVTLAASSWCTRMHFTKSFEGATTCSNSVYCVA